MSNLTTCPDCNLPRFHGVAGYAGPQCLCHWKGATLPKMYDELREKNAALEAECEKWHQQFNCMQLQRDHHRDKAKALTAELAAIRAAGREAVEAMQIPDPSDCYGFGYVDGTCIQSLRGARWHLEEILDQLPSEPLMTVAQHQRIVAARAAELEQARNDALNLKVQRDGALENMRYAQQDYEQLRAELEAARKQSPIGHVALGSHTGVVFYSHMPQLPDGTKLYALPPLAGQVSVPRELLERVSAILNGLDVLPDPFAEAVELRALLATPSMEVKS